MDKQVTIKSIAIQIGKKELSLSPKEAEELYHALNKLFGRSEPLRYPWLLPIPYSPPAPYQPIVYCSDTVTVSCLPTEQSK